MHKLLFASLAFGLLVLPVVVILGPGTATGTSETMTLLPAYNKYQCGLCHTSTTPTLVAADLNVFGSDFKNNGNVWDRTLADMNSDDDRCLNGFELGDQDGDGVFDGSGEVLEHSNPADPNDCNIALNQATWGIIKDIFSQEILEYIDRSEIDAMYQFSRYFP